MGDYVKTVKRKGALHTVAVKKNKVIKPSTDIKDKIRKDVEEEVFDVVDAVADNGKLIGLLFYFVKNMWKVLPEQQKLMLGEDYVSEVDTLVNVLENQDFLIDTYIKRDGLQATVGKLVERQVKISNIVNTHVSKKYPTDILENNVDDLNKIK